MESKTKLAGHPIHPMLIVFPLGLLVSSVVFDILYLATGNEFFTVVAYYNIAGGIIGGLAAAVFGFADWTAIPDGTRAKKIGIWHAVGNLTVLLLFTFSWLIRRSEPGFSPPTLAVLASLLGVTVGAVSGWLGGELVDRLGVGVDPGANLNAPNSLTGQPADSMVGHLPTETPVVPVTGEDREREPEHYD